MDVLKEKNSYQLISGSILSSFVICMIFSVLIYILMDTLLSIMTGTRCFDWSYLLYFSAGSLLIIWPIVAAVCALIDYKALIRQ